jgi:GMP synthase (glutamine-hydrolysing)
MQDRILIVDFGSQFTQLIARRVREAGVYSEIVPFQAAEKALDWPGLKGIILSGGPASVHETASPRAPDRVFTRGLPVLGICYGEQAMCAQLGGRVEPSEHREFGKAYVEVKAPNPLFDGVWQTGERHQVGWPGDCTAIPPGFKVMAVSDGAPSRPSPTSAGISTPPSSTWKWCTRRTGRGSSGISSSTFAAARATGRWPRSRPRRSSASRSRWASSG